ncbi:cobalamin-binding protein [Nocardioides sp. ChNu-153]|uniref:helical backbone metal receptor n=1 Tax=unclassified Nocardioides TaxID=2615069 RepID=UPI002405234F|nr:MULTISPECIES: helical backbone metal receptor [unclassified Nocardioides]MDF9714577.1 helical backbone metal receptor [Nocardioides sp. ChNu-99]MDN7119890.1 cobalamin-binding protein [Nocardioides sp. ChNu-153]
MRDDLGVAVALPARVGRVVSLVPSLTEALADVRRDALVGVTDWCTHPADLADDPGLARVRGTKNPDVRRIVDLAPDVVVANKEENRELDVRRLREAGVAVWVTDVVDVPGAVGSMERLLDALGWARPSWLTRARAEWCGPVPAVRGRVVVPVWRDPWMVVGPATFTADLLRRVGLEVTGGDPATGRYPRAEAADLDAGGADLVLLPDEPYVFTAADGPEAFTRTPTRLVSGRLLTWYGPSLGDARAHLAAATRDLP